MMFSNNLLRIAGSAFASRGPSGYPPHRVVALQRHLSVRHASNRVVGIRAAAEAAAHDKAPMAKIFSEDFSLDDRVALISGGNGDIGLEMAVALAEAGARAVYCVDLPQKPSDKWEKAKAYVSRMEGRTGTGRLEYVPGDVTDQEGMWKIGEMIGDREGRMDVGIACAGIAKDAIFCLDCPADLVREVIDVNTTGTLFAAQGAGRQMSRFGKGGSIILVASTGGLVAIQGIPQTAYGASKAAVIQMARSMACELAPQGIRVNSLSPGWIQTPMTDPIKEAEPEYFTRVAPIRRVGQTRELRGATVWLASDASSFCIGSNIVVDGGLRAW